jgi:hypothetical protein
MNQEINILRIIIEGKKDMLSDCKSLKKIWGKNMDAKIKEMMLNLHLELNQSQRKLNKNIRDIDNCNFEITQLKDNLSKLEVMLDAVLKFIKEGKINGMWLDDDIEK